MNKDDYKMAINKIRASEELKEKTFENIQNKKPNKIRYIKYLSSCAILVIVFTVGFSFLNNNNEIDIGNIIAPNKTVEKPIVIAKAELPRFENIEQLKEVLEENTKNNNFIYNSSDVMLDAAVTDSMASSSTKQESVQESATPSDFSTTNVQVDNVHEADIVKTDGDYIYYVTNNKVYIVKANNLKIVNEIKVDNIEISNKYNERFTISEIYIQDDKLVVLGNSYLQESYLNDNSYEDREFVTVETKSENYAKAMIYDISEKENIELIREVALDGNYINSRMINDNLYFISQKNVYYRNDLYDYEILPKVKDSSAFDATKIIECTDIAYFEGSENNSYILIGGLNINNYEKMNVETIFGAENEIYASERNLYIAQNEYDNGSSNTIIYKFALDNSKIYLQAKGKVQGYLNNQFSMDEYDGNLRIATTVHNSEITESDTIIDALTKTTSVILNRNTISNSLYILDENLQEIGKIENLAKDEKIYSVRFMNDIGYVVTFKQIDPLFVIDLSDPTNPTVKGELKIPGYSSYLHPYDENHIIGIGYNTKDNGYGGTTNDSMKMSMFDVSDLENPKEIFNINIGNSYIDSEVTYNHKSLFYKKADDLIGFPVTDYRNSINGFIILKINLEDNRFEEYANIMQDINYKTNIDRIIYIEDNLYTLSKNEIKHYDLKTLEKLNEVELKEIVKSDYIIPGEPQTEEGFIGITEYVIE